MRYSSLNKAGKVNIPRLFVDPPILAHRHQSDEDEIEDDEFTRLRGEALRHRYYELVSTYNERAAEFRQKGRQREEELHSIAEYRQLTEREEAITAEVMARRRAGLVAVERVRQQIKREKGWQAADEPQPDERAAMEAAARQAIAEFDRDLDAMLERGETPSWIRRLKD
jgi:4-alpha-glucanotransferase